MVPAAKINLSAKSSTKPICAGMVCVVTLPHKGSLKVTQELGDREINSQPGLLSWIPAVREKKQTG